MARATSATAQVILPVTVERAWSVLSDTPRMVGLDPALEAYEPENGVIEQGTLNRVTGRVGPVRLRMTTRTEVIEAPHWAVFVTVAPSGPVRVRAEDTLEAVEGGCLYSVTSTADYQLVVPDGTLASIRTPMYFLWGEDDPFGGPDTARQLVERIPGAIVVALGGLAMGLSRLG